ncbi:Acetyl-CoA C-acyltransferase [Saccharolobus shibatae B12]|uniref:Acetyl-CoA C-acyltransferase n=1 Tax=Saccharolobus shibatae (strain ATCC 51178 / DSM 5389 / JCM 8931 / NBRC 15437 / B12) TaxID=523848 RepID=A0A8F5BLP8_SACSH|nr:thiolase family protein [Saccharolobus shibatae]QXJ27504.1 Acetyl-CoA C-acyltransferase [Saccharolobus shibatae B12]
MITGFTSSLYKKYQGSTFELLADTVFSALEMAGLDKNYVDGIYLTYLPGTFDGYANSHFFTNQVAQYLGIRPKFTQIFDYGGASALSMIHRAYKAIKAGEGETILCIVGGKATELRNKGVTVDAIDKAYPDVSLTPFDRLFRGLNDLNPVSDYALVANRHRYLFKSTDEQRALIAVRQRFNAMQNSKAMFRDPLTIEQVLKSPLVSYPLHLLEIVYPIDGFHVFVVSKRSSKSVLRNIDILGYGEAHWPFMPTELDEIVYTPAVESSKGLLNGKIDAFELYDSFTITVMLQVEDIGLAEKGKGGSFFENHDTTFKGDVPINTGGGSLNTGQPAYMSGGVILEEALLQLNDMADGHQVKGTDVVFLNGIGGWNRSHSVSLVLGEKK